jgi:hypothetical protein
LTFGPDMPVRAAPRLMQGFKQIAAKLSAGGPLPERKQL